MLVVTAKLKAAPAQEAALERVFFDLAREVRAQELGCSMYVLCKGREPGRYVVVECYADQAALAAHGSSAHFKAALPRIGACLEGPPEIEILTALGADGLLRAFAGSG
jgi:quinol monooxygenase YgiN